MKYQFLKRPKSRNWRNAHAKQRRTGRSRTSNIERAVMREQAPPPVTRKGNKDYLFANCVVLAAAVFGPASQAWAEALLPAARQLDARGAR